MKDKDTLNALDELSKGSCMGMDAIEFIIEKVKDEDLKTVLKKQYDKYQDINQKIEKVYKKYSKKEPHETSTLNKTMTWYGIEIRTIMDDSASKLAELLLQGTNMGIIEGRKLLNKKELNKDIHSLIQEYVDMQESAVEKLKEFL